MIGIELVTDRETKAYATAEAGFVRNYCLEHGVLIGVGGNFGNVLRLQPPLVIADAELDTVFATVAEAIAASRTAGGGLTPATGRIGRRSDRATRGAGCGSGRTPPRVRVRPAGGGSGIVVPDRAK